MTVPALPEGLRARVKGALAEGRLLAFTGAGISAESGVPTFRGPEGMWNDRRPEELATPEAFRRDPDTVWEWYAWRRSRVAACEPNQAHLALARWSLAGGLRIVTQNVDGLHDRALDRVRGQAEGRREEDPPEEGQEASASHPTPNHESLNGVVRLHGSLFRTRCTGCGRERAHPFDAADSPEPPACDRCGAILRPAVVWFGEALAPSDIERSLEWAREADVTLSIGTSAVVFPAAQIPFTTLAHGGAVIEINPMETPLSSHADFHVREPAATAVPFLLGESPTGADRERLLTRWGLAPRAQTARGPANAAPQGTRSGLRVLSFSKGTP